MGCPICGSGHILLALGEGGRATCQRCGASWSGQSPLEEKEAAVPFPIPRGPRHTVEIPVRGASAFEVGMEIVSMLVRDHGATVLEYDIGTAGGSLRLRLPVPTSVGTTHHRSQRAIEVAVTVGQGVVVVDRELRVRVWNPQAEELWGLRSDEVLGKQFTNLDIGLPVGDLKSMLVSCLHDG